MKLATAAFLVALGVYVGLNSTCEGQRKIDRALARVLGGAR